MRIFGWPELKAILSNWKGVFMMLVITLSSFWAIGFSRGSEEYLKVKMESPFVTFVGIEIPYKKIRENRNFVDTLENRLNSRVIKDRFQIEDHSFFGFTYPIFQTADRSKKVQANARQIKYNDPLYTHIFENILNDKNRRLLPNYIDFAGGNNDWSLIVTKSYLDKLGYSLNSAPAYLEYYNPRNVHTMMPIPLGAVVPQLPDGVDLLVSQDLYSSFAKTDDNPLFLSDHDSYIRRYFIEDLESRNATREKIESQLKVIFKSTEKFQNLQFEVPETCIPGAIITLNNISDTNLFVQLMKSNGFGAKRIYNFNSVGVSERDEDRNDPDHLNVQFSELEMIEDFEKYMVQEPLGLSIDMNVIEAGKNFKLFSKISKILSVVLAIFSIVFIITYLTRSMIEHIDKNAKNLGTLKAFGLSNEAIAWIYTGISGVLVIGVFSVSLGLVLLLGPGVTDFIIKSIGIITTEPDAFFSLTGEFKVLLFLCFVVAPVSIIGFTIFRKIKGKSPGDLIYER